MTYKGVIIEESLLNQSVLNDVKTTDVRIRKYAHSRPFYGHTQCIIRTVEVPKEKIGSVAERLSKALDSKFPWYVQFRNSGTHYIVFPGKVFVIDCFSKLQYEQMLKYAESLGLSTKYLKPPPTACKEWDF